MDRQKIWTYTERENKWTDRRYGLTQREITNRQIEDMDLHREREQMDRQKIWTHTERDYK